jgi:hypothetical protein
MNEIFVVFLVLLGLVLVLPLIQTVLQLLRRISRTWLRWRHIPLVQKNHTRAGIGGFLMIAAAGLAVYGSPVCDPYNGWGFAGLAGLGLLYLIVGAVGSQGARFDVMSVIWWGVLGLACAALLHHGIPV